MGAIVRIRLRNDELRYGLVAQVFHWTIVLLVIAQFVLANLAEDLPLGPAKVKLFEQHKSIGITIFALVLLRLSWRWINPVPAVPPTTARWQRAAAHVSHALLYALLLAMPLAGWLMSSARNFSVSWFRLFTLPDFIAPNERAFEWFRDAHHMLAKLLFVVALVHVAAALKHHFVDRDNVLRRMLPVKLEKERHEETR